MKGHLRLVCELDASGRSILRERSFSSPVHVGKSFQEDGCCLLNVVNPTAGLLQGDRIDWDVEVRTGARLILSSPSASRAFTMKDGRAEFSQTFRVATDGWLEVNPSFLIPQREARYVQKTRIELEKDAGLFWVETLAPGRVASEESFAFTELDWDTQIRRDGHLILKERFRLRPDDASLSTLRVVWDPSYFASIAAIHPSVDCASLVKRITEFEDDDVLIGSSTLPAGGLIVKVLSRTSPALRKTVEYLRDIFYDETGAVSPALRR